MAVGDSATAEQHYGAALTIADRLAAADPAHAQVRNDVKHFRHRLAELLGPDDPA